MIVYKVTSPTNRVYIGISNKTLQHRKNKHIEAANRKSYNGKFLKAIRKYGNMLNWEIIEECNTWDEAQFLEKYYIKYFDSFENGYNSTLGGDGIVGFKYSTESRKKMSQSAKGRKKTETHIANMKLAHKTYNSKKCNIDKRAIERGAKPFLVLDMNGIILHEYINRAECARDLNLHKGNIRLVLKKQRIHTGNYKFIYKDEFHGKTI